MKRYLLAGSVLALVGVTVNSCSKKKSEGGTVTTKFQPSQLVLADTQAALRLLDQATGYQSDYSQLADSSNSYGQAIGSALESVGYYPSRIILCGTASVSGSASSCSGGEFNIYSGDTSVNYDTFTSAEAVSDVTHFVDFLDPTALAKLAGNITYSDENVRTYDSAMAYWYRPFKIKATVTLNNGVKIYTKKAKEFRASGSGLNTTIQASVENITTPPAEEGVFFLPNGGTYFMLPKKFEITEDDVKNKIAYKIVMAFDPDGMITGGKAICESDGAWMQGMCDQTLGYRIDAPFLNFAPVVAKETETIMRETYMLRSDDGFEQPFDVRLSLYYVKEDANKDVRAVTATSMYVGTSTNKGTLGVVYGVTTESDGTISFLDSKGSKMLKNFKRMTATGTRDEVSSELCMTANMPDCPAAGNTASSFTYTLISVGAVESSMKATYATPTAAPTATATP